MWPEKTSMNMFVTFSTSPEGDVEFSPAGSSAEFPSFVWKDISYGDWNLDLSKELEINIPPSVQNNGSLWAEIFLSNGHASPDPKDKTYDVSSVVHVRKREQNSTWKAGRVERTWLTLDLVSQS